MYDYFVCTLPFCCLTDWSGKLATHHWSTVCLYAATAHHWSTVSLFLEVWNCLIFRYSDHSFLFKSQLAFGMQISIYPSKRKLYLEEKLSHSQNTFHSIVHSGSHSSLTHSLTHSLALFSPFIELLEMNHSLNGPHASQLTCDAGFISRDWKSFFFSSSSSSCWKFEKDFLKRVWW